MAKVDSFVVDLTVVLWSSAIGGFITNRLKQPVLLGYLFSGLIIGPFGLGLINNIDDIKSLAAIGVALLLFTLGVEFSLAELKRVQDIAIKGSILQISLTITIVALFSLFLGWVETPIQGIFLGAVLSLSSTAVVLKTLTEKGDINTIPGQVMLAILIAQDIALGLMLAILPALNQPSNLTTAIIAATLKALIFFGSAFAFGYWLVPPLMKAVAQTENSELFVLTTIALCLGVALVTASLGLSIEMGAFVAGLIISEIDYSDQALAKIIPLRDTFASLFFASIGMLIDPEILLNNITTIIGLVVLIMFGKACIIFPIIWKFGYSFKTAVQAALGLNQIGEFSFVLALTGQNLGLISQEKYLLLIGTTAITLVLTPIGMKLAPEIANKLTTFPLINRYVNQQLKDKDIFLPDTIFDHVVVAGYGRVGQVIVKILQNRNYPVLVIENSEAAAKLLRRQNIPHIFGDADADLVLEKAYLKKAKALAIALPNPASTRILLKHALTIAPNITVFARSHNNQEIDVLTQMGAKEVVQPEFEAALEMGGQLLTTLGEEKPTVSHVLAAIREDRYVSVRSP